jgi:hypothetical protein
MTSHEHDDRDDRELARRIGDAYAPPPLTAAQRARFDAELDTRIARHRWRLAPWLLAAATAAAAALLVVSRLASVPPAPQPAVADAEDVDEEFVLALAGGSSDELAAELPADYQAIASLLELP